MSDWDVGFPTPENLRDTKRPATSDSNASGEAGAFAAAMGSPADYADGGGPGRVGGGLSPNSPDPLHAQLAAILRDGVRSGRWQRGGYIPSESELMAEYGVSRGTVRRAVGTLVDEGLLVRRKGSGTIVSGGGISRPGSAESFSFATSLEGGGVGYRTHVLDRQVLPAPSRVAERLRVAPGEPALFLRRVRSVGGRPVICQESWSNLSACPGLDQASFEHESLFDAVERCSGGHIALSHARYLARQAGSSHGAYLACDADAAVVVLEQRIELSDGTPIEWSLTWLAPGQSLVGTSTQTEGLPGPLELGESRAARRDGGAEGDSEALRRRLELDALEVRRGVVEWGARYMGRPFHFGGALSMAEIAAVLLDGVMHTGKDGTPWNERDRLVVSKAHASIALYPMMRKAGLISDADIERGLFGPGAVLFKHPERDPSRGFEVSGGSLGMGLGYATGLALALRRDRLPSRVFCIVGDGECDEGSVWESAAFAGHNQLSNLVVVVDANGMQLDGPTAQILDNGPINRKFASFGFDVVEVDGHDVMQLADALGQASGRPRAVIARTVKGRGLSFAEGNAQWHDKALDPKLYRQACAELDAREQEIVDGGTHGR